MDSTLAGLISDHIVDCRHQRAMSFGGLRFSGQSSASTGLLLVSRGLNELMSASSLGHGLCVRAAGADSVPWIHARRRAPIRLRQSLAPAAADALAYRTDA